jgi:hypothetical protein
MAHETALVDSLGGPSQKMTSLLISEEAYREAATPATVKESFEKRGIYPWDPTKCLANALELKDVFPLWLPMRTSKTKL